MKTLAFSILSLAIFLTACEDPAANKPKAQTSNSTTNTATTNTQASNATTAPAKSETLALTPDNSKVEFTASKVTGHHDGGFKQFKGTIDLINEKLNRAKSRSKLINTSVFTDTDQLTTHLKSPDFFDVAKFPKSTFTSTSIVPDAAKGADNYTVTGDFDLHGQKKSIVFPATVKVNADTVSVNAEFSINRKDFGILYAGKADDLIRDDVVIKLDLKAPRKK
jgi:polyisoprenoid-binding protein YceI